MSAGMCGVQVLPELTYRAVCSSHYPIVYRIVVGDSCCVAERPPTSNLLDSEKRRVGAKANDTDSWGTYRTIHKHTIGLELRIVPDSAKNIRPIMLRLGGKQMLGNFHMRPNILLISSVPLISINLRAGDCPHSPEAPGQPIKIRN